MKPSISKQVLMTSQAELLKKMRNHLERYNFLGKNQFKETFGFSGEMVKNQVKQEWMLSNVVYSDEPVFNTSESIVTAFGNGLVVAEKLPFSVVQVIRSQLGKGGTEPQPFNLMNNCNTILRKTTFCLPTTSTAVFHKQQRERKIWWRKFSALPSRFSLTEIIACDAKNEQIVEIQAEFPWNLEVVEKVQCLSQIPNEDPHIFQVRDGRKLLTPHVVISECHLEKATMVYLCDAYDKINEVTDRDMMRLHRKLAPFKITFAASVTSATIGKDISDLSLVLARKIRKLGLPCLLLADLTRSSLESQFLRADAMGIPYSIVLNDKTLQEGMIGIRSRDTTLREQSHVGRVVPYVEMLYKNY